MKHFSKLQPMNDRGIDVDCPLREAFAPYRLLPEKWQFLKTALVLPNMQTPSFFASTKEQVVATKCDVIPGEVVKLQSPLRKITTLSKQRRAPEFSCTPQTWLSIILLFRKEEIECSWQLIPIPQPWSSTFSISNKDDFMSNPIFKQLCALKKLPKCETKWELNIPTFAKIDTCGLATLKQLDANVAVNSQTTVVCAMQPRKWQHGYCAALARTGSNLFLKNYFDLAEQQTVHLGLETASSHTCNAWHLIPWLVPRHCQRRWTYSRSTIQVLLRIYEIKR